MFVLSVADNVMKFASAVPTPSLIGLALVLGVIYLIMNRRTARVSPKRLLSSGRPAASGGTLALA